METEFNASPSLAVFNSQSMTFKNIASLDLKKKNLHNKNSICFDGGLPEHPDL